MVEDTQRQPQPDLSVSVEVLRHLQGPVGLEGASEVASEVDPIGARIVEGSVVIVGALVVDEVGLVIKAEAALAEEVGIAVGPLMALVLPPTLPPALADEAVRQPMVTVKVAGQATVAIVVAAMRIGILLAAEVALPGAIGNQSGQEKIETEATNAEATTTIVSGPTTVAAKTIHASCEGIDFVTRLVFNFHRFILSITFIPPFMGKRTTRKIGFGLGR